MSTTKKSTEATASASTHVNVTVKYMGVFTDADGIKQNYATLTGLGPKVIAGIEFKKLNLSKLLTSTEPLEVTLGQVISFTHQEFKALKPSV